MILLKFVNLCENKNSLTMIVKKNTIYYGVVK